MHIDLKLGLSCNNYCRHCIMEPIRDGLCSKGMATDTPYENLCALVDEMHTSGARSVTLTGGEPTLRKDFFSILRTVMDKCDMAVTVQTNARLLASRTAKQRLADLPHRNVEFVIAIHGPDALTHDTVTRVKGSFTQTLAAVGSLNDLGFPICGKMVLSRYNVATIAETLFLMAENGIKNAIVAFPHAEEFSEETLRDVLPCYADVAIALRQLAEPLARMGTVYWETIPFCILPDASLFPYSIDLAFLKEALHDQKTVIEMTMTGQKIAWEESRKSSKRHGPHCHECLLEHACEGIWEEYLTMYQGNELLPITDHALVNAFIQKLT